MSYKFAKTLLAGSVFAMGAFGLIACGDEGSTKPSNGPGTSINIDTRQDGSITFTGLNVVNAGTQVKLTGSIGLAFTDTTIAASENLQFTNVTIQIGKVVGADVQTIAAQPTFILPAFPTNKSVSLTEANVMFNLQDASLTECGEYKFIITATANDGTMKQDLSNTQSISFNRPDMYCKTNTPASSAATQPSASPVMVACPEVTLTTDMAPGLDLATCTAVASPTADIVVVKSKSTSGDDYSITSGNGAAFSIISNTEEYGQDYWPDAKPENGGIVHMSDFKYKSITGTTIDNLMENYTGDIYVGKTKAFNEATGAGFFALAVNGAKIGNNGNYTVKLAVYKVQ
ncbi:MULTISPECIES: hypothetical protein [unclassified Fibrobacter]|uniref:hypothetical protein n=1 Tax=unclassified Fibrobacter TaxID=2634177 RepID=UPI000D6D19F3|nr:MULTISPECIES: hypothetical protein [unclassified Fibrobacter]PWJ63739.1 hypothetical protein BGX12_11758 [Fibrobacter sp. UWR4]PZW69127.1 hypothetical protein C8E88_101659 [Fibrobacter sp. UWR1]